MAELKPVHAWAVVDEDGAVMLNSVSREMVMAVKTDPSGSPDLRAVPVVILSREEYERLRGESDA